MMQLNELSGRVIGACIEIHRSLGPGLLESAYEECLCHELSLQGLAFERQRPLPVAYKGIKLDCGYRLDVVVQSQIIVELKAVPELLPVHEAQLLTYLRLSGLNLGLLVNFNVAVLKNGIKRIVNNLPELPHSCWIHSTQCRPVLLCASASQRLYDVFGARLLI